jgi:hypothetical protein
MSDDFASVRTVKARKRHVCAQCRRYINVGETYSYSVGRYDGDFYADHEHYECREVWLKLWNLRDLWHGDTQDFLINDGDLSEDKPWIEAEFPAVAARLWASYAPTPPIHAAGAEA